jgi:hypothetical protein
METGNDWLKLCGKPPNTKTAQIYIARCYAYPRGLAAYGPGADPEAAVACVPQEVTSEQLKAIAVATRGGGYAS